MRSISPSFSGTGQTLSWLLRQQSHRRPDHPFIVWEPFEGDLRTWTYAQFAHDVARLTAGLRARGIAAGDRVIVHTDNCPEFLLSWWALTTMGAVAVCTNTKSVLDEMTYFADHSEAVAAITQPQYASLIDRAMPQAKWIALTATDSGAAPRPGTAPDRGGSFASLFLKSETEVTPLAVLDHASIQYTSGTTSRPKAVVWTQANCIWAGRVSSSHLNLDPASVTILHLPLFHTNAMSYSMLSTAWVGGTAVLMPRFSASRFWDVAVRNNVNWTSVIQFCLKALDSHPVPEAHSIRLMGNGSYVPKFEERYGVKMVGWYGMTETVSHPIVGEPFGENQPGSCGRPTPEYGVAVLNDEGDPAAPGEPGELRIRGDRGISLFAEYLHDPAATSAAFDERGWLITGDRVTLNEDGYITFNDRDKDMLKIGAENVAASEIERVIMGVPGVAEVAVVAAPHRMLDEVPVAFVIVNREAAGRDMSAAIEAACRERLASFKVPQQIRIVDQMPRSTLNKIAKAELRKLVRSPV